MKSRQRITYEFTLTEEEYYRLAAALIAGRSVADDDETHRVVDAFLRYIPEETPEDIGEDEAPPTGAPVDRESSAESAEEPPPARHSLLRRLMAR